MVSPSIGETPGQNSGKSGYGVVSLFDTSYDFIPVIDSDGNPLVFSNAYGRMALVGKRCIQYQTTGGYIAYLLLM